MSHIDALPIPYSNGILPPYVEQMLKSLNGPLCDIHNIQYKLATPLDKRNHSACPNCGLSFNLLRRKHNCTNCGQVVCSDCLKHKWYLPKYGLRDPVLCCTLCDRNLRISVSGKEDIIKQPIRDLRYYLQLYGLYNSVQMVEKEDLVSAIFDNSPMPQTNEEIFRRSLPQCWDSSSDSNERNQSHHGNNSTSHSNRNSDSDTGTSNWSRMFSFMDNDIGRGMNNINQHLSEIFDGIGGNGGGYRPQTGMFSSTSGNPNIHPPPHQSQPPETPNFRAYRSTRPRSAQGVQSDTEPTTRNSQTNSHSNNMFFNTAPRSQFSSNRRSGMENNSSNSDGGNGNGSSSNNNNNSNSNSDIGSKNQPNEKGARAKAELPTLKDLVKKKTDVNTLSVKVLKGLLDKYHVDYINIVEKQELEERVVRLIENTKIEMERNDSREQDSNDSTEGNDLCKICWDETINCVMIDCGHMCTCLDCGNKILESGRRECPICREYITRIIHVFRV